MDPENIVMISTNDITNKIEESSITVPAIDTNPKFVKDDDFFIPEPNV